MLFDVDPKLVKKLARDVGLGKSDLAIRGVEVGKNFVTYVGAKTEDGLEFLREMEKKLPRVDDYDEDDEDDADSDE